MNAENRLSRAELILSAQPLLRAAEKELYRQENPSELPSVWCLLALAGGGVLYFGGMIAIWLLGSLKVN